MTSYMPQSELEAIVVKHKHQWLEGMVTRDVMIVNAVEETRDHAIRNFVRDADSDIARKIVAEYEPHPPH